MKWEGNLLLPFHNLYNTPTHPPTPNLVEGYTIALRFNLLAAFYFTECDVLKTIFIC